MDHRRRFSATGVDPMKEAIPVKQRHIDYGQIYRCNQCPVALALQEVIEYRGSSVSWAWVTLDDGIGPGYEKYEAGENLRGWIGRFDRIGWAKPFILILDHKAKTAEMLEA